MFKPGDYKISKVMRLTDEGEMQYIDIEEHFRQLEKEYDDPREAEREKQQLSYITSFTKAGEIIMKIPIPEGTPQEELDRAVKHGAKLEKGFLLMAEQEGKVEKGEFYLHDKSAFLTGEEWVKISTDTPGEINMFTFVYTRIN